MWTDPLLLAAVPQQVPLELAGRCECPVAAELRTGVGTFISVQALV